MVGLQTLDLAIGVRVPASQPHRFKHLRAAQKLSRPFLCAYSVPVFVNSICRYRMPLSDTLCTITTSTPKSVRFLLCATITRLALILSITSVLSFGVYAQSTEPKLNHFAADGLSFDYPDGYSVTDESSSEAQHFTLTRRGSSVQLTILATKNIVLRKDEPAAIEKSTEPLIKQVAKTLGESKNPPERTPIKTLVGSKEVEGVRLRSSGKNARTGEVIWVRLGLRLISMALVRSVSDDAPGSHLWQTIRSSLRVEAPVIAAMKAEEQPTQGQITGGVLNGKALELPQPAYPRLARAAHIAGTVTVQVLIDEQGNVTSAHAIDGHPLLQPVCVAAAQQAKFSPTLLEGEPVKVTGVIQYNFVAR